MTETQVIYTKIIDQISSLFPNERDSTAHNVGLITACFIDSGSFSTHQLATSMSKITNNTFPSSENRVRRFLARDWIVSLDAYKIVTKFTLEKITKTGSDVCINIDFTSSKDNFQILSAAIQFKGRAIPIFNKVEIYPKTKEVGFDQVAMETSFLCDLKAILPVEYNYIYVLDRGFGNSRVMMQIENSNTLFIARGRKDRYCSIVDSNEVSKDKIHFSHLKPGDYKISVKSEKLPEFITRLVVTEPPETQKNTDTPGESWYLYTNTKLLAPQVVDKYVKRFQIEKTFQDEKSSGYNFEKTKITDITRFRKMLFLTYLAQIFTLFLGEEIDENHVNLKKSH
jgi:hypothetical protein